MEQQINLVIYHSVFHYLVNGRVSIEWASSVPVGVSVSWKYTTPANYSPINNPPSLVYCDIMLSNAWRHVENLFVIFSSMTSRFVYKLPFEFVWPNVKANLGTYWVSQQYCPFSFWKKIQTHYYFRKKVKSKKVKMHSRCAFWLISCRQRVLLCAIYTVHLWLWSIMLHWHVFQLRFWNDKKRVM